MCLYDAGLLVYALSYLQRALNKRGLNLLANAL